MDKGAKYGDGVYVSNSRHSDVVTSYSFREAEVAESGSVVSSDTEEEEREGGGVEGGEGGEGGEGEEGEEGEYRGEEGE